MRRVGDMVVDAKARARFSELWRRWDGILSDKLEQFLPSTVNHSTSQLLGPGVPRPSPSVWDSVNGNGRAGQGPIYLILATSRIRASPASMHIISSGRR